jgi:hypothetical protein
VPFSGNPSFPLPERSTLWRYVSIDKFLAMLADESLFFSRVDHLGDPLEGSYSLKNLELRPDWYGEHYDELKDLIPALSRFNRQQVFVSCWYASEYESQAMWQLYAAQARGVAIRSSVDRFMFCIKDPRMVFMSDVRYADLMADPIPEDNLLLPALTKHRSFEHEREVRALTIEPGPPPPDPGLNIAVDLGRLIEAVVVAPQAPPHYLRTLRSLVDRYGLDVPVEPSNIPEAPIY